MWRSVALAALLGASSVLAQATATCSLGNKCPESAPCCSQYGECGVGAYCLGGCDPRMSFSLNSCTPEPVCKDQTLDFTSLDGIVDISKYLGDASTADWVSQGTPLAYNDSVLLTMPKNSVGTLLASTHYMWYGNVKATFKTSRGAGVITAFILLSDVKDEIDYEFVGVELDTAQTNYYFQGIPDYDNSANISLTDTFDNWHTYEIQWTPDQIQWLIDGQVGRTLLRSNTWNATANQWNFPQTPARVQLSIWPGGLSTNAPGTIAWAGGEIPWSGPDIDSVGYYYATFSEVVISCYNTTTAPGTNSGTSYTYNSVAGTNNTVVDGNNSTVLASLEDTGLDMGAGNTTSASASATNSATQSQNTQAAQIPGGSNGSTGQDHADTGSSGSSSGSSGSSSGSASSPSPSDCSSSTFNQDCGSSGGSSSSSKSGSSRAGASALAIVIAGGALFLL